ncbi:MAG: L-aspartate oxidase [Bacteroidales bacterium]
MGQFDYIIVGSGLAGLYSAYKAAKHGRVALVTKSNLRESNSYFAQGGIAAVTGEEDDPSLHFLDTMIAGRGLCEAPIVNILVNEGPVRIQELIRDGMVFDTENGALSLGLEGGHHRNRILHAGGDSTGRMITEFLIGKVEKEKHIQIFENLSVIDLLTEDNCCYGVRAWCEMEEREKLFYGHHVFLTSGGASAIYSRTTNPETTIGDGIALCYNAGCRVMDMEFIQFHPSALYLENSSKAFLISEAVRGEGAHLFNDAGERFMLPKHELAELAPRDIVARSIFKEMLRDKKPYVYLSLKHLDEEKIKLRFPTIYKRCQEQGLDLTNKIPVAPAAHYTVGGIITDAFGKTDVNRLYVCGELAATGIMGANRLASNSLLECLVFAHRAIEDTLNIGKQQAFPNFKLRYYKDSSKIEHFCKLKAEIADLMNYHSGIIRSELLLKEGLSFIEDKMKKLSAEAEYYDEAARKLLTVASLIMKPAMFRKESRGGHYREDYPSENEEYKVHSIQQKDKDLRTCQVQQEIFKHNLLYHYDYTIH